MTLLAKSDGITLEDHTRHVREEAGTLIASRPFFTRKYAARTGRDLAALLDLCALWHDAGKAHPHWQNACQLDFQEFRATGKTTGKHLRRAKLRHEMDSLVRAAAVKAPLGLRGFAAVAAHHGKLGFKHEKRWEDDTNFKPFWKQFDAHSKTLDHTLSASFERAIALRYEYSGPRALLQLADHRASAREGGHEPLPMLPFDYKFPFSSKQGVQKLVEDVWDKPFAILRAPTGSGKTDACLLWAQHQIDCDRADRLVIAMPTRFTANALSLATLDTLSSTGLYHSSARHELKRNARRLAPNADLRDTLSQARMLETPASVTTLDHLCIALTGAREDHHGIFWNLAHSCVVVDEADFYDSFTQLNMVVLLRALRSLDVPVLVMSATVPESSRHLYALSGFEVEKAHDLSHLKDQTGQPEPKAQAEQIRPRCCVHRTHEGKLLQVARPDDVAFLLQRALNGEPLIIYANTVKRAQAYFDWFKSNTQGSKLSLEDVILYHSRFTEEDKIGVEERLTERLGKDAWQTKTARGVAILTQIGEMSVNISADLMLSDVCPLDRLAQRAGRLARFSDTIGELWVVEPHHEATEGQSTFYPAPYGTFDRKAGWVESEALKRSRERLTEAAYSAQSWVDLVNEIYDAAPEADARAKRNARQLEDDFARNWLIVPAAEPDENDDETLHWKSRDIASQKTIYVGVNTFDADSGDTQTPSFQNWRHFRDWEASHAVQVYVHEFKKVVPKDGGEGLLEKITAFIGDDEEILWCAPARCYTTQRGLRLTPDEDEEAPF